MLDRLMQMLFYLSYSLVMTSRGDATFTERVGEFTGLSLGDYANIKCNTSAWLNLPPERNRDPRRRSGNFSGLCLWPNVIGRNFYNCKFIMKMSSARFRHTSNSLRLYYHSTDTFTLYDLQFLGLVV